MDLGCVSGDKGKCLAGFETSEHEIADLAVQTMTLIHVMHTTSKESIWGCFLSKFLRSSSTCDIEQVHGGAVVCFRSGGLARWELSLVGPHWGTFLGVCGSVGL